ncbi:putative peptide chain release factor-like protein, mitochondrial [Halotydeus destructor]|nr:putative peptide chain release factor-like protein, mitochondrial [Halotydeus destructor]
MKLLTGSLRLDCIKVSLCRFISKKVKDNLDYSKFPNLVEEDLEEQFIHGGGPGGQAVNKAHNCVLLKHKPTGLVVKAHESREGHKNRIIARENLLNKLDEHLNGQDSILNQIKRLHIAKKAKVESKAEKRRELKKAFKEREESNKECSN